MVYVKHDNFACSTISAQWLAMLMISLNFVYEFSNNKDILIKFSTSLLSVQCINNIPSHQTLGVLTFCLRAVLIRKIFLPVISIFFFFKKKNTVNRINFELIPANAKYAQRRCKIFIVKCNPILGYSDNIRQCCLELTSRLSSVYNSLSII